MKERSVLALFVCVLLITLTGVGQAQDIILPPDSEVPIEILMGVIGKYTAMVQEYQSLIDQNGVPESIVAFRLAAEVAIPDEVTGADLTSILGGISGMAYWVEATIFARHDLALSINLSGSLGNMEIVSTPDGTLAIARDEAVFARILTEDELQQTLDLFSFEGTWPDDSIPLDSDILASAEQFIAFVQESLTDAVIEYDGLEVTPRGMAHVVRITLADTGESITLWVLDETWELCKVGFDDPVSGSSAITIIKEADLVIAEIPNSAFDVDVTGLAEISYEDFLSLIALNISLTALMGTPVVGDLSLSTAEVLQGEQVVVRSNGMDGEDEESALVPEFEYMPPDDSWIPLPAAHYVGVAPAGHWEAAFVPSIDGFYGFRVSYTDTNGITSNSMELFAEIAIVTAVPPQVVDVDPKDGSGDVSVSSQVAATFSQEMEKSLTQSAFLLTDESGAAVSGSFEWNDNTLVFSPDQDLTSGQLYSAKILGSATSLNGVALGDDFSWGFTTESVPLPQVIDVSPKDGSTDVVVSSQVTVTFSKGMQEVLTQASFSLADESGAVVSGSFEWNDNTLVFSPDQDLMYGQLYSAKILGIAPDLNGFPMGDDFSWGFTTELAPLPQVIDVSPKDGSTDVSVSSQVTATFSQEMEEASAQSAFLLTDESGAAVSGSFEWNDNTLVFNPDLDLVYGQFYSAKILGTAAGLNGATLGDDFSWGFTTEVAILPQVIDVSPENRSKDVSVSSQVTATFSQEMEKTSTQSAFLLTGESGAAVSGSFEWNENTLVFSPDQDLAYGQFYSAKILGTAAGINTATLGDDFSWGFTTEFAPLPKVAGSNPSDGQRNVPISGQVSVTFTEDMDQASVENAFSLMAGDQAVIGSFQWAGKTLTFIPGQDLEYNTAYRARVAGSARSALGIGLDGDGNGASEGTPKDDVVWKFTAEAFPVIAVKPASQAALGGDFVTVDIVAEAVSRLRSFSVTVNFNPDVLSLLKVERRDFANWRPRPKFITDVNIWRPTLIDEEQGIIVLAADSTRADGISGTGALATITFRAAGVGESPIQLKDASASNVLGVDMAIGLRDGSVLVSEFSIYDANHDGVVDILDFITMQDDRGADTDINGDGVTDILDLVAATGGAQASPGFAPTVSALGYNYPNPFNPETWIPYQLAKDANVVIRIYGAAGRLVRTLDLGYRTVGRYSTKNIAAHWDGANEAGEPVASGIYYYNIRAGAFSAVKKMVILE